MRYVLAFLMTALIATGAVAQTETPTPVLSIPLSGSNVFATVASGQMTRFQYVATAGDVLVAVLLTLIVISVWGFFFVWVLVLRRTETP
jgi:tellurite resistance protein TehA-like permease